MSRTSNENERPSSPLELGRAAAIQLDVEWQLDAEISHEIPATELPETPQELTSGQPPPASSAPFLFPNSVPRETGEPPPTPEQIVEAMLFIGGPPLDAEVACAAVRGLTLNGFRESIDSLNRKYRQQNRPYSIHPRDGGFALTLLPAYRGLREQLFGGPREARLNQTALDVLSIVAYRQPVGKAEVDAVRGMDSGAVVRQLVRLGLIAVQHRADAGGREVRYGTTPRFLQVFGLGSLDELPRLGDTQQI